MPPSLRVALLAVLSSCLMCGVVRVCGLAIDLPEAVVLGELRDWLVHPITTPVTFAGESAFPVTCRPSAFESGGDVATAAPCLRLSNGLISRTFTLAPDFGTVDAYSHSARASLLRTLRPEARLSLDGRVYDVGGLQLDPASEPERAYANRSAWRLTRSSDAWTYLSYATSAPEATYPWTPGTRFSPKDTHWPPLGLHVAVTWRAPDSALSTHRALVVQTHYEMYEGIPLLAQWLTVNGSALSGATVLIDAVQVLSLAVNQDYSPVAFAPYPTNPPTVNNDVLSRLYVATDQAHSTAVVWQNDAQLGDTPGAAEPELNVTYTAGPGVLLSAASPNSASATASSTASVDRHLRGQPSFSSFTSFRVFLLVTDTVDRERHGLSVRALTRTLAPATLENPVFFHATDASSAGIRAAVDQMAAVGFELLILSFGTSFDLESTNATYVQQMKEDIAYAHSKGIEVGGYDLIVWTRDAGEEWNAVSPDTNATHGDACIASGWYDRLLELAVTFIQTTGLSAVETDGPYPGRRVQPPLHDLCTPRLPRRPLTFSLPVGMISLSPLLRLPVRVHQALAPRGSGRQRVPADASAGGVLPRAALPQRLHTRAGRLLLRRDQQISARL